MSTSVHSIDPRLAAERLRPKRRLLWLAAATVRAATDRLLDAAEAAQEELLVLLSAKDDRRLRAWIETRLPGLDRRLRQLEDRTTASAVPELRRTYGTYAETIRDIGRAALVPDGPPGDPIANVSKAFSAMRAAAERLRDEAARWETRLRRGGYLLTLLGSWAGAALISLQLVPAVAGNVWTRILPKLPPLVREIVVGNAARETQVLDNAEPCNDADWAALRPELPTAGTDCKAWDVAAWRDLQDGVALIPVISPPSRIIRPVTIRSDELRRKTELVYVSDQLTGLKVLCVTGLELGDRLRFVVWYRSEGTSAISAKAVRGSERTEESRLCDAK